jgi:hypothetical protein
MIVLPQTQADLDEIIERRIGRERRRMQGAHERELAALRLQLENERDRRRPIRHLLGEIIRRIGGSRHADTAQSQ